MPKICDIDDARLISLRSVGATDKELATTFDASIPTIKKRIKQIEQEQGIVLKWRDVRNLELTRLQALILDSIDEDSIREAPLGDRLKAFQILHNAEGNDTGNSNAVQNLFDQFVSIAKEKEKQQKAFADSVQVEDVDVVDAEITEEGTLPKL